MNEVTYMITIESAGNNKVVFSSDCYEIINGLYESIILTEEIMTAKFESVDEYENITTIKAYDYETDENDDLLFRMYRGD